MGSPVVILVVDDDPEILECCALVLEGEGYKVVTASNGRKALTLIQEGLRPDCTLLDLMMPVMDGWQFCDAMRTTPGLPEIPIIVVSADNRAAEKMRGSKGVFGALGKPFDLGTLLEAVAEAIKLPRAIAN